MIEKFKFFIYGHIDSILVSIVYIFIYLYSITHIPELVIPPHGTDPFCFDIITDIISKQGIMLKLFPTYFFSPLDAYFLLIIKYFANNVVYFFRLVIFIQMCFFLISAIYLRKTLEILFPGFIARLGFYLLCVYPPIIFQSMTPVKDIIALSSLILSIYNIIAFNTDGKIGRIVITGFFLSIAMNMRSTLFFLIPTFVIFIYQRKNLKHILIFLISSMIFILPFSLRNLIVGKEFCLLSSVAGIHLYIGNHSNALGVYTFVRGVRPSTFGHYFDTKRVAESELRKKLTDSAVNKYWKDKAWDYISKNPISALKLYIKKLIFVSNVEEISNNYGLDYFRSNYLPFKLMNYPFSFGILFVLGILGFRFSKIKYKWFFASNFLIIFFLSAIIFVTSRYRLPLVIFLMIGTCGFIKSVIKKEIILSAKHLFPALILTMITYYPVFKIKNKFYQNSEKKHFYSAGIYAKYKIMDRMEFNRYYTRLKKDYLRKFKAENLM